MIGERVELFARNLEQYRQLDYKEAQLRREFLDPFFEALGWDVTNRQGWPEQHKEVVNEDALKIGGATKAPDYAFRIGGARKFFAEAKKPSRTLKTDASSAYQLRRYAWSAKLPLSILSDFEELAVYDCRARPAASDKATVGRINYFTFDQYLDRLPEIYDVFSKDAVMRGSFDHFMQEAKGKRGTSPVDAEFLKEIEGWRATLAKNIATLNPRLTLDELNDAVQRTIDRIIFLRMAEDRGTEPYGQLQQLVKHDRVYAGLLRLCQQADDRYNSGLFDFSVDTLTPRLKIDDDKLRDLLGDLYYPKSPYEFSVLGADTLGNVYEQFLGKVIRLTSAHQAKVEEKPEVKKAGGVYYTPAYIVDYIVAQTVGKLVEGKTPDELVRATLGGRPGRAEQGNHIGLPLRILDPACGSGSFLLGAYQCLLDHYLAWYEQHRDAKQTRDRIYESAQGWRLTTAEKKRILTTHIFGVDIDRQAVEVTKLSLLLKVLEGENVETLGKQLSLFKERALPNLDANIKCGNSLIGPDYFAGQLLPDAEEMRRVNPFDWAREFPQVFADRPDRFCATEGGEETCQVSDVGGFDCVIGNPPYIRSQSLGAKERSYFTSTYQTATGTYDIYVLFVERGLTLTNKSAKCGFILPNKFFTTDYGEGLRKLLGGQGLAERLVDFEDGQVFSGAGTYTTLLFLSKKSSGTTEYARLGKVYRESGSAGLASALSSDLRFSPLTLTGDGARWTLAAGESGELLLRLQATFQPFIELHPHIFQGLKTSADKIYLVKVVKEKGFLSEIENGLGEHSIIETGILMPVVKGENVRRYDIDLSSNQAIVYMYHVDSKGKATLMEQDELSMKFPKTWDYLKSYKKVLGSRDKGFWNKRHDWYAYARSQNIGAFLNTKILVPYMTTRIRVAPDERGQIFFVNISTGGYGLNIDDHTHHQNYFIALLNSSLMNYCIQQMTNRFRGGYFAINKQALERLPIRTINFADAADKACHDKMVALVTQMLDLHKRLAATQTVHDRDLLQRQIAATDSQIDMLVYELYGLTEEEIKVVEG
ncbi:MAG: Eco57I restriction-modification methylase domain-containing protein [Chloroflexi bacterium]|nr:Eco57I restriction-modification methylase domain-containing protein [Chloroflexota bacterium]